MKVEVQDVVNPYSLWIATVSIWQKCFSFFMHWMFWCLTMISLSQIIENVGGRLLLRYDTPDSSSPDFWLYFTSSRIYPMGWCSEKGIMIFVPSHYLKVLISRLYLQF